MCRKLVVTNKLSLGSRELGWEAYSLPKGEVLEFTSKQLKDAIRTGAEEVYGLMVNEENGELELDAKGFYTTNLMNKVHINSLTPLAETDCLAKLFYIVIGTRKEKQETKYEVISSRFERLWLSEERTKLMLEMGFISSGAKLENGEIVVASMEKQRKEENKEVTA